MKNLLISTRLTSILLSLLLLVFIPVYAAGDTADDNASHSFNGEARQEGIVDPGFYEHPAWFKQSFLDLSEDLEDANANNKIIFLYFYQDGCPYCKKLLEVNFTDKGIVNKMKQHYEILEINIWGDRPVTLMDGSEITEKEFARQVKVMFTPTLIALDPQGKPMLRMNGYYAVDKFTLVLDYLLLKKQQLVSGAKKIPTFKEYYQQQQTKKKMVKKKPGLFTENFIVKTSDLKQLIETSKRPVMILFEQSDCAECKELHGDVFRRLPVYQKLKQYTITQVDINSSQPITTPNGQKMAQKEYARTLNIQYTPSIYFYQPGQKGAEHQPVFKAEAYLKSFHMQVLLDYVLQQGYLSEPEFQRYVQDYADKLRAQGKEVDIWK